MYVPPTPKGTLMKMLSAREKILNSNSNMRIKFIEKGGTKFRNMITKKNPFKPKKCEEQKCPICHSSRFTVINEKQIISCETPNVGYRFTCLSCQGTYEGETARLLKVRTMEHIDDLAKKKIQSPLVKHIDQCHPQENIKFKISQTGIFFDSLSRQADEAVRIKTASKSKGSMNSRSEFHSNHVARVKIAHD